MLNIKKSECCGCSACSVACRKNCIIMKVDNEGFLYPNIQKDMCVNCGRCERVCPIKGAKKKQIVNEVKKAYLIQNKDRTILKESTSGGFFSELAKYVIGKKGIVFGAAYDENFIVKHVAIETCDRIKIFRNSKYTQSDVNNSFYECKRYLESGKLVCFSGTACQIAGLDCYLEKKYDNLIKVDVVCRGVPSPLLFDKYIEWCGGKNKISSIKFRDKHFGYYSSMMSVYFKDGRINRNEIHSDPMLEFFFSNMCSRPSCHECVFKTQDRVSDFTMFDCWHANKLVSGFNNDGTTALIVRNSNAEVIFNEMSSSMKKSQVDLNKLIELDGSMMLKSTQPNIRREEFFKVLNEESFDCVMERFNKKSFADKLKLFIKKILIYTGVFEKYMEYKFRL